MDSSMPSSGDLVPPPLPMDAIECIREMSEQMDPPSKRFESSDSMNPFPPPTMDQDVIESIREMCKRIDLELIDTLVRFIETQLPKMNLQTRLEAGSSSSEDWFVTVGDATKLAATTIDTISTEAQKLSESYALKEMGSVTVEVMKGVGEWHCVLIGMSVAAFTLERYLSVGCKNGCKELLLKILELAKEVKPYVEQMPEQRENVCNAVVTIVEGALICLGNVTGGKFLRFWSAKTALEQLEKTNQQLADVSVGLRIPLNQSSLQLHEFQWRQGYGGDKDVFLSHSGKQKYFVRELHQCLIKEHVSSFFDQDENSLPLAEKFPDLIFKAARTCKIALLVLSKEFIFSRWPMIELAAFVNAMKSGENANLKLLPIFFTISPKELAHYTKESPEWKTFVERNDRDGDWQVAIDEVRPTDGLCFGKDENKVEKVVKAICDLLKQINPEPPLKLLDFEPVGIEKEVEDVKALLDMKGAKSALAVNVCGFGGVGKSTIAASVVQYLDWSSTDFKFCRVAIDEKTEDTTSHIIKLQKDIINDLEGDRLDFRNIDEGRVQIKKALENKCSLLFIDNVINKDYIKDLLPKDLSSGERNTKLRILITSREKIIEPELKMICKEYNVSGLSHAASQRLLFETIFPSKMVEGIGFDEIGMINDVAAACRGVPLLLSVFGKHLRVARDVPDRYRKEIYEDALDVLREGNLDSYVDDEDLGKKVMFVYDKIKDL